MCPWLHTFQVSLPTSFFFFRNYYFLFNLISSITICPLLTEPPGGCVARCPVCGQRPCQDADGRGEQPGELPWRGKGAGRARLPGAGGGVGECSGRQGCPQGPRRVGTMTQAGPGASRRDQAGQPLKKGQACGRPRGPGEASLCRLQDELSPPVSLASSTAHCSE